MGINRFENGKWDEVNDLKLLRDGSWQTADLRRYDGMKWEQLWPCHFNYTVEYALTGYAVFKRRADPVQIQSDYLITGSCNPSTTGFLHDSLLFFPVNQMKADLAGVQILKAALQLKRSAQIDSHEEKTTNVNLGYALSGVDPARADNSWSREFTLLTNSVVSFGFGQKRNIDIGTDTVNLLMKGKADCLCLPTTAQYTYNYRGYGYFEPSQTVLAVTYYK